MLRKYLVLGIMMGALALTGCGAEEKKDNDKDEVKATQEAEKGNESEDNTVEDNSTSDDGDSSEEANPTEGLVYKSNTNEFEVKEWDVPAGDTDKRVYYYGPITGPKALSGHNYLGRYTRMDVLYSIEVTEDENLKEALVNNYAKYALNSDIDSGDDGYIEDVQGEYVTISGVECYKYTGTAGNGNGSKFYVSGYIFDHEGYKGLIQCRFTHDVKTEEDKAIALAEIENNLEVAMKGFRIDTW